MHHLLEALKPFGELFNPHDMHEDAVMLKIAGTAITAGDIRKARKVYAEYKGSDKEIVVAKLERILEEGGQTNTEVLQELLTHLRGEKNET